MIAQTSEMSREVDTAAARLPIRMGIPSAAWGRDDLYQRALWEHSQINTSELHTARYCFLGKILLVMHADVEIRRWKSWCLEHGIQRDRWQRGRLLAMAFASPEDVADLPILAAVARAKEVLRRPRRQTAADAKVRRRLNSMNKALQSSLEEVDDITDTNGLRRRIAEARKKLAALDCACVALDQRRRSFGATPHPRKHPK